MADVIITPNMSLPTPTPGVDPGPDYGNNNNQCFNIIDGHNHTPGSGVQITPLGLDINIDLPIGGNDLTQVGGIDFISPGTSSETLRLYTAPSTGGGIDDLFFNDAAGNVIQLTKAGIVNATAASIPGQSYAGGTFTWKQGAGSTTPANFDIGSIIIRPNVAATTYGVELTPPSGISSQYDLVLPAIPSTTSILQLDNSGNITSTLIQDNSTIVISGNTLEVPAGGITTTQIANGTILPGNIASTTFGLSINPTVVSFTTAGSYTFTVPATVSRLFVFAVGGGGGGGGGGTSGGGASTAGAQGGQTTFNSLVVAQGGNGGGGNSNNIAGVANLGPSYDFYTGGGGGAYPNFGSAGMPSQFFSGAAGGAPNTGGGAGGGGASSFAAGGAAGTGAGTNGTAGTLGSGGGGGGGLSGGAGGAGGNGGQASISIQTVTPSASISIVIGAGGAGGGGVQTSGGNGGDGALYIYY